MLIVLLCALLLSACGPGVGATTPTIIVAPTGQVVAPDTMGVFVQTPDGLLKLPAWEMVFVQAPPDTVHLSAARVGSFVVYQRNIDELERCRLWAMSSNSEVQITLERMQGGKVMQIRPQSPLSKGSYVLEVPKDSMMGGRQWYYVIVD